MNKRHTEYLFGKAFLIGLSGDRVSTWDSNISCTYIGAGENINMILKWCYCLLWYSWNWTSNLITGAEGYIHCLLVVSKHSQVTNLKVELSIRSFFHFSRAKFNFYRQKNSKFVLSERLVASLCSLHFPTIRMTLNKQQQHSSKRNETSSGTTIS